MRNLCVLVAVLALAAVSAIGLAACGSDSDSGSSAGGGGDDSSVTIAQASQPDFLDPALSYTIHGWEPMWLVYTPLLTYKREDGKAGSELMPGLAEAMPEVSEDGKTYKLTLRKGLEFSDGTPVKASDFEHTIKRVLNLESGGAPYYEVIKGADAYLSGGNADADISGIKTNDKTGEITIELSAPEGAFSYILAMNFAGVVPGDTPFENMTKDPAPGVGAYMFTKSEPNREFVLERNPKFSDGTVPGVPVANIPTVRTVITPSVPQQTQEVIGNELDFMQEPVATDFLSEILDRFGPDGSEEQRYKEYTTLSTYYFFLNGDVAPFDDPKVREAVNIGVDKPALARLFAGTLEPGCSFLPPEMPGYVEALDSADCPWGDPSEAPDLERAKQLIKEAGAEGAKVTVWGDNVDPTPKVTQAYADQLNQIGLDAEPKILDGGVYFQTIGNQSTGAQTGFLNWFGDFPHPSNFFFLVDGATIQPTNNQNMSNVDDPHINKELAELAKEPDVTAVADRWEALNEYLVDKAYLVPYGYRKLSTFLSDRMNFADCTPISPQYYNDYSQWCLKDE
ncbi:MAG TPA: ABC transporter substrate-binding protein [Solirubrobacterales bacterium]|nr:ABC transporter substrate-binding protein [Solirubrobacterales bacterium]